MLFFLIQMIYFLTPFKLFGRKFCNLASCPPHIAEMLQGIQSTESKQTIFLDSLCSIGIYVQKTPFYKKMLHIKEEGKSFLLKTFFFDAVFFTYTWIEHNE